MKRIMLTLALCSGPLSVFAAQTPVTTIDKFNSSATSINNLREATNTRFAAAQSNFTEIYTALNGSPWLAQTTAPNIHNVFWIDTSSASRTIKYWDGDSWEVAASGVDGTYTLPTASTDTKGGVKIGARLTMTGEVLSADVQTTDISGKQDILVSGTNIKTVNGTSVLGSGNLVVGDGGGISHAPSDGGYYASKNGEWASLTGLYAPALGTDDNYVTDAEKTRIGNLEATDSASFAGVTATGAGGLKAGVESTTRGAITLYSNVNHYAVGINSAATPTQTWTLTLPPAYPGGSNYLLNVDADGTSGWTDPASFATPEGSAASMIIEASGFNGNLATTDNTLQELGDAVDNLVLGSGSMTWPTTAGIAVYGGSSAWGTSLTLDTDLSSVSASDDSVASAKATKTALDLKANTSGISFVAAALSDLKYDPDTGTVDDEYALITNTGSVGDTNDATVVPTLERAGTLFSAAAHNHTGTYQPADAQLDTWAGVTPGTGVATALAANTGAVGGLSMIIASGSSSLATAEIAANTCSLQSFTATGAIASTDRAEPYITARLSTIAGYGVTSAGALRIDTYLENGSIKFDVCNPTGTAITPGALTIAWKVLR